jgi:tripartite-type tricarboxylate transporter receptor subunit TctC
MIGRRLVLSAPFLAAPFLAAVTPAFAFPTRQVHLIVPFGPAGGVDFTARVLSDAMGSTWGTPPLVENRAGAGGIVGTQTVAHAAPDGYTLLMGSIGTLSIVPAIRSHLPYDAERDFVPVARLTDVPNVLVVRNGLAAHSVKDVIELARANPDSLTYSSAGVGTSNHMAGELFQHMTGTKMRHVPYKGGNTLDLVSGLVDMSFDNLPTSLPYIQTGRLRALAVTGTKRSVTAPDLPTIAESGVPGFDVVGWVGLFAPAKTPPSVVEDVRQAVVAALARRDVIDRLMQQGAEAAVPSDQPGFADFLTADRKKWKELAHDAGIKDPD